jgi:hypothetical protein
LPKYEYCRYRNILGNTGNTSIADTGRFWKILVIPVLQILFGRSVLKKKQYKSTFRNFIPDFPVSAILV